MLKQKKIHHFITFQSMKDELTKIEASSIVQYLTYENRERFGASVKKNIMLLI